MTGIEQRMLDRRTEELRARVAPARSSPALAADGRVFARHNCRFIAAANIHRDSGVIAAPLRRWRECYERDG